MHPNVIDWNNKHMMLMNINVLKANNSDPNKIVLGSDANVDQSDVMPESMEKDSAILFSFAAMQSGTLMYMYSESLSID